MFSVIKSTFDRLLSHEGKFLSLQRCSHSKINKELQMSAPSTSTVVRVPFTELQSLLQAIFQRHGCSEPWPGCWPTTAPAPSVMAPIAMGCSACPVMSRPWPAAGSMARPRHRSATWPPAMCVSMLRAVFAQPALAAARELLVAKARSAGIAVLAIHNSHHFAALWPDVEPFAEEGLVASAWSTA